MKKRKYKIKSNEFDLQDLKAFESLPVKRKLQKLTEMQIWFSRFMPAKSKKAWEELRKKGW